MDKPTSVINNNGQQVTLTWIKTSDFSSFTPYFQVYGIIFNQQGEILLIQEKGKWKIPGGTPENGEQPEETLRRELLEEADVEIDHIAPLGVQKVNYPNNPNHKEGDLFYQYRYICLVKNLLPPTPDPATRQINPRILVPTAKVTDYVQWGPSGQAMFTDAIAFFPTLLTTS